MNLYCTCYDSITIYVYSSKCILNYNKGSKNVYHKTSRDVGMVPSVSEEYVCLNGSQLENALKNCGKTILLLHVVRALQLTEKKNKKTMKSRKRRWRFLHDDALELASKVSTGYCTVPLPHRRCLSPVLTSVQE